MIRASSLPWPSWPALPLGTALLLGSWAPSLRAQSGDETTLAPQPDTGSEPPEGALPGDPPAPAQPSEQEPSSEPGPPAVQLPQVIQRVEAVYPQQELAAGLEGTVLLLVTVSAEGLVTGASVLRSAGTAFDGAALAAVKRWRFLPARRADLPIPSRIEVPIEFKLPAVARAPQTVSASPATREVARQPGSAVVPPPTLHASPDPIVITVEGERSKADQRGASHFVLDQDVLAAAPHAEGAEVLRATPGLYFARGEGAAVAHSYVLRGFDSQHGQDIEFRVGGIPINLPSHIHGQGYADLGFLIGETVLLLHAAEGVADPRQGDFAVAGSLRLDLGVEQRGIRAKSSYGSFNTFNQLLLWAPPDEPDATFGAVHFSQTDGFGQNRAGQGASAIVQARWGDKSWRQRVLGILSASRADHAGVVRADDVEAGVVDFYGVYDLPTAQAQNALSSRLLAGYFGEYRGQEGDDAEVGVWFSRANFRLQENFTGFVQRSAVLNDVAGRGDLIEQQNASTSLGLLARYRTSPYRFSETASARVELGTEGRVDDIDQAQNLLDASVRLQTWDQRVDATVHGTDLGFYADSEWQLGPLLDWRVGVRADALSYDVNDRLGNFVTAVRPQDQFIVGFRRSAAGVAWGPRTSLEFKPAAGMGLRASYGEGYRSPQARTLQDGENAPFSKVRSLDLGIRVTPGSTLRATLAAYYTRLSDDVAFDAEEGRLERIGITRRRGFVAHADWRPQHWALLSSSLTYVDADLREPPPASADEPFPPFARGQSLPFVPPWVLRVDGATHGTLADQVGSHALGWRTGLGFSYLSPRPLPFGEFADPVYLVDAGAGLNWGPFELSLEAFNLLDRRYAAIEYSFVSNWSPDAPQPRTPARHFSAGAPRSLALSLGVTL